MSEAEYLEWKQDRYSFYKDRIADLRERAASSSDFVDQHLISVSSGVVGLSFALLSFLESVVKYRIVLCFSWFCFIAVIILVFVSHEILQRYWSISEKKWTDWFKNDQSGEPNLKNNFGDINTLVMLAAKLLFLASFIMLVTFIGYNLPK